MPLSWILEALLDVGAMALTDAVTSPLNPKLSPLDAEVESLRKLMADYDLRIMLSDKARESIEALNLDARDTRIYVRQHVRVPLSQLIQRGDVRHGSSIRVEWKDDAVALVAK